MVEAFVFIGWVEFVIAVVSMLLYYYGFSFTTLEFTHARNSKKYLFVAIPMGLVLLIFNPIYLIGAYR